MTLPSDSRTRGSSGFAPEELAPEEVEHLSEPFFSQPLESGVDADRLDYQGLGGRYLQEEAMEGTFIPAFFALQGLSLLCPLHANFTRERCERLLELADEYGERGPAVEWLCDWVRQFANLPDP